MSTPFHIRHRRSLYQHTDRTTPYNVCKSRQAQTARQINAELQRKEIESPLRNRWYRGNTWREGSTWSQNQGQPQQGHERNTTRYESSEDWTPYTRCVADLLSAAWAFEPSTIVPLRSMEHKDVHGNPIGTSLQWPAMGAAMLRPMHSRSRCLQSHEITIRTSVGHNSIFRSCHRQFLQEEADVQSWYVAWLRAP